jgi:hypothetical protein
MLITGIVICINGIYINRSFNSTEIMLPPVLTPMFFIWKVTDDLVMVCFVCEKEQKVMDSNNTRAEYFFIVVNKRCFGQ